MKKLISLIAGCLMVACNTAEDFDTVISNSKRFHATFADEDTRTFVDEKIRLRWTKDDLITLFEGTTRNKQYKFLGETGDNAGDFEDITTGFGSGNDIDRYYAIYPYSSSTKLHEDGYIIYNFPEEQTYAENSFGLGANPMVAVTSDLNDFDLCFRNAAGYLRLYLYGEDVTIKSIKIEGNNSEPLAGKAYITPEYGGYPTTEMDETATSIVTLNCGSGVKIGTTAENATPFWIALPPTVFSKGFTITATNSNGDSFIKKFSSEITIGRNKYISARLEFEITKPASIPNNEIWYTSSDGNIVTPNSSTAFDATIISNSYVDGKGVITFNKNISQIGEKAFAYNCKTITSIQLPNSVLSIGKSAFSSCRSLKEITLPDQIIYIGDFAFNDCWNLENITIPNNVTSLMQYTFSGCNSLKSITIPDKITSIEKGAFANCYALATLNLGNSIKSIESEAFIGCKALSHICIPNSVTTIGDSAFQLCKNLLSIVLSNNLTSIGNKAFADCDAINSITIPSAVTSIGNQAFYSCDSLTNVIFNNCTASIGNEAFYYCLNLTAVELGDNITSIGNSAFKTCKALNSIDIPSSVYSIGDNAFNNCSTLKKATIGNGVNSIGENAFYYCQSLTTVILGNNINTIGNSAFYGCYALYSITIPDSVTSIGERAFQNCKGLNAIYGKYSSDDNRCLIINGVLNSFAPYDLTSYTIPNNVKSISDYAFYTDNILENIIIPNSVTSIGKQAFCNCPKLSSITIGNNIESIDNSAFYGCSVLSSITINSLTPPLLGTMVFDLNASNRTFYVPASALSIYKSNNNWKGYANFIKSL